MIKAIKINDDYPDLYTETEYEVVRIYSNGKIQLKESPRRYFASSFRFLKDGKKMDFKELHRLQQIERVKKKLGMK